jgi:hypothetical protein
MTSLTRAAIAVTAIVSVLLFTFSDMGLALTNANFCIVLWRAPFSERVIRLPDWAFSIYTSGSLASVLVVIVLWFPVALRFWKRRRASR